MTGWLNSSKKSRKYVPLCLLCGLGLLIQACVSAGGDGSEQGLTATHYTLEAAPAREHESPLPDETRIFVDWHYTAGESRRSEAFRGWDFDGDQRFEMVEVLNTDGSVQSRLFDFDGDGRIDSERPSH